MKMGRRHGKKRDNGKGAANPNVTVTETSRIQIAKRLEEFRDGDDQGIIHSSSSSLGFFPFLFPSLLQKFRFLRWVLVRLILGRLLLAVASGGGSGYFLFIN